MGLDYTVRDQEISLKEINFKKVDKSLLEYFLTTGTKGEVRSFIKEYFMQFGDDNVKTNMICQYITLDICFCCINLMERLGYESDEILHEFDDINSMTSGATTKKIISNIENMILIVFEYRDMSAIKKYNVLITNAKKYINENYLNSRLNSVADYVKMSPSHFSVVFKQETGLTFIDYLTEVRMKYAKELLRCTSKRIVEIGKLVGYKDSHYFNTLFRKNMGCTPLQYRKQNEFVPVCLR